MLVRMPLLELVKLLALLELEQSLLFVKFVHPST
eukprot:SAG31_NODE_13157_length_889_cov_1.175949_1_plen_33_part_10